MPNPFDQRVRSVLPNDEKSERLPSFRMLHSCSRAFVNPGDGRHLRLDLREAHADAANLYELTRTPVDPKVSLSITRAEVAGLEPAMIKLLLRRFRVIEVSTTDRRTST